MNKINLLKRIIGNHAYEILNSFGFIFIVLICWGYSRLGYDDTTAFWGSVYPSAFVHIRSVVISTSLITYLVNRKRVHNTKKELYSIIKVAHTNLFAELYVKYLYIISVREGQIHGKFMIVLIKES